MPSPTAHPVNQILNTSAYKPDFHRLVRQIDDCCAAEEAQLRREKPTRENFWELPPLPDDPRFEDPVPTDMKKPVNVTEKISENSLGAIIAVLNAIEDVDCAETGFLIVVAVLKMTLANITNYNKKECGLLFKSMINLSKLIMQWKRFSNIKMEMGDQLRESIQLIVEGAFLCCSVNPKNVSKRYWRYSKEKKRLQELESDLNHMCQVIQFRVSKDTMTVVQDDLTDGIRPLTVDMRPCPTAHYAVGIEKNIEEVIQLLDFENDRATTSVVVTGPEGSGKTTLADAVYDSLKNKLRLEGWKHSKITFHQYGLERDPEMEDLQSMILQDCTGANIIVEDIWSGWKLLQQVILKERLFLYIENATWEKERQLQLFFGYLELAKKLRFLVTTRDCRTSYFVKIFRFGPCIDYFMEHLSIEAALQILCRKIGTQSEMDSELQTRPEVGRIAEICKHCPQMLKVIGVYIHQTENKVENSLRVLLHRPIPKYFFPDTREYIMFYEQMIMLIFDRLDPSAQKAFLDICSNYYIGLEWEKVALVVGKREMSCLEGAALIKNEDGWIKMDHLILKAGCNKLKSNQEKSQKQISPGSKMEEKIASGDDLRGDWKSEMIESPRSRSTSKDVKSSLMVYPTPPQTLKNNADKIKFRAESTKADRANNRTRICHLCKMKFLTHEALVEHISSHRKERRRQLWQGDSSIAKDWSSHPSSSTDSSTCKEWEADSSPFTEWVADPSTSKDWLTDWLANSSTSKDWLVELLEDSSNSTSWQHKEPENVLQASSSPSIIRKVHPELRALRPESYDPKKVGLGIYHHDMSTYSSEMGEEKLKALCITAKRIDTTVDSLVAEIQALDLQIRKCYPDGEENPLEEILSWNIAMDTCFILEFFRSSFRFSVHINEKEVMVDIFKLENQIPLFLLKVILEMEFPTSEEVIYKLAHMLCMNPQIAILPFSLKPMKLDSILTEIKTIIKEDPCHLLHLLSRIIEASFKSSDIYIDGTGIDSCIDIVNGWMDLMSAAVIDEDVDIAHKFLIRFKRSSDGQVRFKRGWFGTSVIYLPPIYLLNDTEPLFWNLIALAAESESNIIGHFIFFMKCIINLNNENATLLMGKQIIVSKRRDEEIVRMFENIPNVICRSRGPFENVWGQVKEHHSNPLNKWMLGFTYLLSWVALIRFILLILTTTFGFVMR